MSATVRVIPCLDVDTGRVVKGVNFVDLVDAGDPVEMARVYESEKADELTFLDITATSDQRDTMYEVVRRTAQEVAVPLTVGGGVRSVADVERLLASGAHKASVNTAAIADPDLLWRISERFGEQTLVLSVDARRSDDQPSGFEVTTHGGRRMAGLDVIEWVATAERFGVGEILLTSMDADGTRDGFDVELIAAARERTGLPIIASGGAGTVDHFCQAADAGANAVLAASVFHFGVVTIDDVKRALTAAGHGVS